MPKDNFTPFTAEAGTLELSVGYDGARQTSVGFRHAWRYQIEDTADPTRDPIEGSDIHLSPLAPSTPREALRTLTSYLEACGDSYGHAMRNPGAEPENLDLFPEWVPEAAYVNSEELGMLAIELERPSGTDRPDRRQVARRGDLDQVFPRSGESRDTPGLML